MSSEHIITEPSELDELIGEAPDFLREKVVAELQPAMLDFIASASLIFVSTIDEQGRVDCSPKGDGPGFVQLNSTGQLLIPERPGNKLTFGFRNLLRDNRIGLIFVTANQRETLRVKGRAQLSKEPALLKLLQAQDKDALLCTLVTVEECFFHCGKAMIRSKLWQPDSWPEAGKSVIARQLSEQMKGDAELEQVIDSEIEKNYREELY